jgi:hypothetical protein
MCRPHRNKKSRMSSRRPRQRRHPDYIVCDTSKCESDDSSDVTTVISSSSSENSTFAFGSATKATAPSRKYSSSSTHINHSSESSHEIEALDFLTKVEVLSNEAEEEKKAAAFWSQFDDDDDVKSFGCGAGTCLGVLQFSSFKQFFMCE